MSELAPRNAGEAAAFLLAEHKAGHRYPRECLILQRTARGVPSLFPTARSSAEGTPHSERVPEVRDLRRGMIGYSAGKNPAGHVFFIAGRRKGTTDRDDPERVLTWTNDADEDTPGSVELVPLSFYADEWGHDFLFGATWLNGYDFADFNAPPKPAPGREQVGANFAAAIRDLRKALRHHRRLGHDVLVAALSRDLEELRETAARFS